ncbi:MAG TPA: prepilin peptidase [Candidatus Dormibacteraeota bacterium]|nr:prepilin peptidase [Candidatus Dormibacteraeota bacterium]
MVIVVMFVLGLALGSFVNALVWRLHEQSKVSNKKTSNQYTARLSISHGRSMCPNCKHQLAAKDLLPVVSWLFLKGKCRYCNNSISIQYPIVEILLGLMFVASFLLWPVNIVGLQIILLILWLILLVGFMALVIYDLRWMLLPNRLVYPLIAIACLFGLSEVVTAVRPGIAALNISLAVLVGGGLFYGLFQVSGGKWIGGGDVKLGFLLGLIAGTPVRSFLFIFLASLLGSLLSLPLLLTKRLKQSSRIPFGPLLIAGLIIVQFFGTAILLWYQRLFLPFTT